MEKWEQCKEVLESCRSEIEELGGQLVKIIDRIEEAVRPRVLTLDEALQWKDAVWVEEKNGDVFLALIKRIFLDRKVMSVTDWSHYYSDSSCEFSDYGRLIRYWTGKPTKEQQEETGWNE